MATSKEILAGYINDMLAVERDLHAAFRRQKDDACVERNEPARQLIAEVEDLVDVHVQQLSECLRRLGTTESALKKTIGSVTGVVAALYDKMRPNERVSRMLRDDYTALHFALVCYEMLHLTALGLKHSEVADLALRHYTDFTAPIIAITDALPEVLSQELSEEEKITADGSLIYRAVQNIRAAWEHEGHTAAHSTQQQPEFRPL